MTVKREFPKKKRKSRTNKAAAITKAVAITKMGSTGLVLGVAWGIAKKASKPLRRAAKKADGATTKAIKGLFNFKGR